MQEQEPDGPLTDPVGVEGHLVAIDIQIVESPVLYTTDGKKIIHPFYPFAMIMN